MTRWTRDAFLARTGDGPACPVVRELTADTVTPTGMLLRLARSGRHPFLLESIEGGERVARWSFAGCDPDCTVEVRSGTARVDGREVDEPALEVLRRYLVGRGRVADDELPPFSGGAIGWLGYDAVRLVERVPDTLPDPLELADAWFGVYRTVAALDRVRQRLLLVALPDDTLAPEDAWSDAQARLDRLERTLAAPLDAARPAAVPLAPAEAQPDGRWTAAPTEAEFLRAVARAREEIRAGEAFQIVLSRRWRRRLSAEPTAMYRALRLTNPAPYMFYLDAGDAVVLGASPETLATVRAGEAVTRPIAGTRPRGATAAEDEALAAELLGDEKERAEHLMLVDLGRNDIARIAAPGTVEVVRFMDVERYSHVMHLVSEVRGEVESGRDALDVLLACFPAGTLSGAPKVRAMELIDEMEALRRGIYGGAVGYFDVSGDMDACIAIRMAVLSRGSIHAQAGAGVVFDSVPESELAECANKVRAICLAADLAEGMHR